MAKIDSTVLDHLEWLGYVQPNGLVVSAPALAHAGAILDRQDIQGQRRLREVVTERPAGDGGEPTPVIDDFEVFAREVLGWNWSPQGYAGTSENPIPEGLVVHLAEHDETLRPTYAVRERDPGDGPPWQLLVSVIDPDDDLDAVERRGQLDASPHGLLLRMLRRTGVSAGLLTNGRTLRLISAPEAESAGWLDFHVADLLQTAGRPMCSAMRLLLNQRRLLALPKEQRLAALLSTSRKYQNEVSERLAEQVLHALYELLRGLQAANDASRGELLADVMERDPNQVYRALLTVLLRLVFLLYAEERGLLPQSDTFLKHYSLTGLYERLREDAALFPDTMDQRFGAWAQLLVLFRLLFDGAESGGLRLPARHGELFDPHRFPFLDGSNLGATSEGRVIPLVPDGTIARALEHLLVLDGERLSYRALDVEQIGSVYETMMGFRIETTTGRSVAIRAQARHGAPTVIDLDELLAAKPGDRAMRVADRSGRRLTPTVQRDVKAATTIDDLRAALHGVTDHRATPDLAPPGSLVLQPSDERRRSGSHYTPRELTEPIVRTTLEPILQRLAGDDSSGPTPEQLLDLKVCDPAMGSGAFLVEACRQLGDALVAAWRNHDATIDVPADEDETIYARRLVAQRCLYGVDRNPVAVDLAKVSLWLITLAKEHPLTFLDHALRHGDSLVGLSKRQLQAFHWDETASNLAGLEVDKSLEAYATLRELIREPDESVTDEDLRALWDDANEELQRVRLYGDLAIAAFFEADSARARETKRAAYAEHVISGQAEQHEERLAAWRRDDERALVPFHWEIEFPEVFERPYPGFDAFIGNPPFLGGSRISEVGGMPYFRWLTQLHEGTRHHCDLVAHFFRRAYALIRVNGCLGLIATNTIAQGDTREGGLARILGDGGSVYCANRRRRWPGIAAVIVSTVHIVKRRGVSGVLDSVPVSRISAYLVSGTVDASPLRLEQNPYFSLGVKIYGQGFIFADDDEDCEPVSRRLEILEDHPDWEDRVPPYVVGEDITSNAQLLPRRYVIWLSDVESEAGLRRWPELRDIVIARVKPGRMQLGPNPNNTPLKRRWWAYQAHRPELQARLAAQAQTVILSRVAQHLAVRFGPTSFLYSEAVVVIALETNAAISCLQSRPHELWARFFGSSLEDRLRYTPSDCFETFPFPENWTSREDLESVGKTYYDYRAQLMIDNDEGLTKTYNRFHDPNETDPRIVRLRELHAEIDRAVLDAYGWTDIPTDCEFLLDYEIDEEEYARRRKPYRYRWPDEVHDEVLGRLLELNAQRAAEEAASSAGAPGGGRRRGQPKGNQGDLFS